MDKPARGGTEGELYGGLEKRPALEGFTVPGHRAVAITNAELRVLAADPRWLNVNRWEHAIRRAQPADSGFYGTLGPIALFVRG